MIPRWITLGLLGGAAAGLGVALWAGPNVAVAAPAAGAAALAAGGYAAAVLAERVRFPRRPDEPLAGDPIVGLRDAFRSGAIGRQKIIQTVGTMERALLPRESAPVSPDEERRLLTGTSAEFHAWVEERVRHLERET